MSTVQVTKSEASRVVGVYAHSDAGKVFLYEEGCVVAGSELLIRTYLGSMSKDPGRFLQVRKIRFGDVFGGLKSGAVYAFDKKAYTRFYPLARRAGIDDLPGFPEDLETEFQFMKVKFDSPGDSRS